MKKKKYHKNPETVYCNFQGQRRKSVEDRYNRKILYVDSETEIEQITILHKNCQISKKVGSK